jgi:hypothetical protein
MCSIDPGANDSRFITNFSSHVVFEVILILTVLAGAIEAFSSATSGTEQPIKLRKKHYPSPEFIIMLIIYIENNTWVRGNTRFISSVEHDISRVRAANE